MHIKKVALGYSPLVIGISERYKKSRQKYPEKIAVIQVRRLLRNSVSKSMFNGWRHRELRSRYKWCVHD